MGRNERWHKMPNCIQRRASTPPLSLSLFVVFTISRNAAGYSDAVFLSQTFKNVFSMIGCPYGALGGDCHGKGDLAVKTDEPAPTSGLRVNTTRRATSISSELSGHVDIHVRNVGGFFIYPHLLQKMKESVAHVYEQGASRNLLADCNLTINISQIIVRSPTGMKPGAYLSWTLSMPDATELQKCIGKCESFQIDTSPWKRFMNDILPQQARVNGLYRLECSQMGGPRTGNSQPAKQDGSTTWIVFLAIAGTLLLLPALVWFLNRKRIELFDGRTTEKQVLVVNVVEHKSPKNWEEPQSEDLDVVKVPTLTDPNRFLSPVPERITSDQGDAIRKSCRKLLKIPSQDAKVCLTYADGQRPQDAPGYGPGTYFASSVLALLNGHGVPCFSELMLPIEHDKVHRRQFLRTCLSSKSGRFSSCQVLIVLQTQALYECIDALSDIYAAQKSKIEILPLRIDSNLPSGDEVWPQVDRTMLQEMMMVSELQGHFCNLNSIPSPPYTVVDEPCVLVHLLQDLRRKLGGDSSKNMAIVKATAHMLKLGDKRQDQPKEQDFQANRAAGGESPREKPVKPVLFGSSHAGFDIVQQIEENWNTAGSAPAKTSRPKETVCAVDLYSASEAPKKKQWKTAKTIPTLNLDSSAITKKNLKTATTIPHLTLQQGENVPASDQIAKKHHLKPKAIAVHVMQSASSTEHQRPASPRGPRPVQVTHHHGTKAKKESPPLHPPRDLNHEPCGHLRSPPTSPGPCGKLKYNASAQQPFDPRKLKKTTPRKGPTDSPPQSPRDLKREFSGQLLCASESPAHATTTDDPAGRIKQNLSAQRLPSSSPQSPRPPKVSSDPRKTKKQSPPLQFARNVSNELIGQLLSPRISPEQAGNFKHNVSAQQSSDPRTMKTDSPRKDGPTDSPHLSPRDFSCEPGRQLSPSGSPAHSANVLEIRKNLSAQRSPPTSPRVAQASRTPGDARKTKKESPRKDGPIESPPQSPRDLKRELSEQYLSELPAHSTTIDDSSARIETNLSAQRSPSPSPQGPHSSKASSDPRKTKADSPTPQLVRNVSNELSGQLLTSSAPPGQSTLHDPSRRIKQNPSAQQCSEVSLPRSPTRNLKVQKTSPRALTAYRSPLQAATEQQMRISNAVSAIKNGPVRANTQGDVAKKRWKTKKTDNPINIKNEHNARTLNSDGDEDPTVLDFRTPVPKCID